jgi:ABC-type nitrate/sulfonate/bicarbonate transport system permease component
VTVTLLAVIGLVSFNLIKRLEQKIAPWRQGAEWTLE